MAWEFTPQGFLKTKVTLTRTGDFDYYGYEIGNLTDANKQFKVERTEEELKKAIPTFDNIPIVITHPDHKEVNSKNWKELSVGIVTNARLEDGKVVGDAIIQDKAAIDLLKKNPKIREVSVGYDEANIEKDGEKYKHVDIRANHLAIVAEGRAGSDCKLNDSKTGDKMKFSDILKMLKGKKVSDSDGVTLTEEEIKAMIETLEETAKQLDGSQLEEIKAQIEALKAQLAKDEVVDADADATEADDKVVELVKENEELKAKIAELQAEIDELKSKNDADKAINDAKARFPRVNLLDAKTARDVKAKVLIDHGIYKKDEISALTDAEIKAAYAGLQASTAPRRNPLTTALMNDSKPQQKQSASKRLGGK